MNKEIIFNATYQDKFGKEKSFFRSDGSSFKINLRDFEFEGIDFFNIRPISINNLIDQFFEIENDIENYTLDIIIPIIIRINSEDCGAELFVHIADCNDNIMFKIKVLNKIYQVQDETFEDALVQIQKMFPQEFQIKSCLSCKYAQYYSWDCGSFGYLRCFKDYSPIQGKSHIFSLMKKYYKIIKNVQETFCCEYYKEQMKDSWSNTHWSRDYLKI